MDGRPLPLREASRRIAVDRQLLQDEIARHPVHALTDEFRVRGGPLGDFCETLRDLVGHVLMWDEINLAVLADARAGRGHWSLDASWETPGAGRALNRAGIAAARELPVELLLQRFEQVRGAVLAELASLDEHGWAAPVAVAHPPVTSVGGLAEYVMTVPNVAPYWHAAVHLGQLEAVAGDIRR